MREAGLNYPPGTPLRDLFEKRLKNREPLATFALTNSLAAALAPWLVVGLGLVAATWHERRRWIAWTICFGSHRRLPAAHEEPQRVCGRRGRHHLAGRRGWQAQGGRRHDSQRWSRVPCRTPKWWTALGSVRCSVGSAQHY